MLPFIPGVFEVNKTLDMSAWDFSLFRVKRVICDLNRYFIQAGTTALAAVLKGGLKNLQELFRWNNYPKHEKHF